MFTGIVEETGTILSFRERTEAWELTIAARLTLPGLAVGDSMAVNGCCLTVVGCDERSMRFQLLGETIRLTSFQFLREGAKVNLERSLRFDGKVGGHFVSGHIDTLGRVTVFEPRGKDVYLRVRIPEEFSRYLVYKGSIAVEGISLTVAETEADEFAVWLIPHTLEVTNLTEKKVHDYLNLEFDLLAKYVEKLLPGARALR